MKTIAFIRERPFFRIYKNAMALRKTGNFRLVLIARDIQSRFIADVFDEVKTYGVAGLQGNAGGFVNHHMEGACLRRLSRIVKATGADICHTVAVPDIVPKTVIESAACPVVYDEQDFIGISNGIENLTEKEKSLEKFCFEHADGILYKGPAYEMKYYRQHGYNIKCPTMQWLPYCDESLFTDAPKLSEHDGEIHIVYAGNISLTPESMYSYYIPLAKELASHKIHLHIYPPVPGVYKMAKAYHALARKEGYFHFHKALPYTELNKELAKYDWGMWVHIFDTSPGACREKWKVAIGNKMFSYLESGLPVIINMEIEYGCRLVRNNKIGVVIKNTADMAEKIKASSYEKIRKNVMKARIRLSMGKNVKKLEKFYGMLEK